MALHLIPHGIHCIRFTKLIEMVNALADLIERRLVHDTTVLDLSPRLNDLIDFCLPITLTMPSVDDVPSGQMKRSNTTRASYIIEKDTHVFGGCMEEEAGDEFFISSGAVYQSWPYVYEPGYSQYSQVDETISLLSHRMSKSVDCLTTLSLCSDYDSHSMRCGSSSKNNSVSSIAAYSLKNFDVINLVTHNRAVSKRRRNKHSLNSESDDQLTTDSNSYDNLDETNDDDFDEDDNSESYLEYKKRHAMGLPSPASVYQYSSSQQTTAGSNYKRISFSLDCNRLVSNLDLESEFDNTDEYESSSSECLNNHQHHQTGFNVNTANNTNNIWPGVNSNNNRLIFLSQKKVGRRYYHPNDYYLLMRVNKK